MSDVAHRDIFGLVSKIQDEIVESLVQPAEIPT